MVHLVPLEIVTLVHVVTLETVTHGAPCYTGDCNTWCTLLHWRLYTSAPCSTGDCNVAANHTGGVSSWVSNSSVIP